MPEAIGPTTDRLLVLVTGASGKIGTQVVRELVRRGFSVRALTTRPRAGGDVPERVEWRVRDFAASIDFDRDIESCDAVVHLAAEFTDIARMQRINVEATRALAHAGERARLAAFCYTSSAAVYGNSLSRIVTEESPTLTPDRDIREEYAAPDALRAYGRTKLLGEIALRSEASAVDYIILRPTMVADIGDVVGLGKLGHVRKSLTARRHAHFVYIADVAYAIGGLLERSLTRNGYEGSVTTYNLAEDEFPEASYAAIFRKLRAATGQRAFDVLPAPAIADQLVNLVRFGALPRRFTFGQMLFSADKLKGEMLWPRFGLEQLYRLAISQMMDGRK